MQSNGLATVLLMIPVLTVPALAIFGIPQFAPVVASPLDEGRGTDHETRVGNSARHTHDELFDDVEGFGLGPDVKHDSKLALRDRSSAGGPNRKGEARRTGMQAAQGWGDDLSAASDWPNNARPPSSLESNESQVQEPALGVRNPKHASIPRFSSSDGRYQPQAGKANDAIRMASTDDIDQSILQAGLIDDLREREKPKAVAGGIRSRASELRNVKRREPAAESLTWHSAVERLNEFEIRSFRLEPGHQPGQFVFICSYSPPDSPNVSYRFEAGADEPLKAVEKVLEQIVEWRQRR